jgi:regulator of protease activity HflC (stomatin/prohibitin superfamily)
MLLFVLGICFVILGVFLFKTLNKPLGFVAWFASAIILLASCIAIVPTGHTGVVVTFGKVADYTFESGINMKAPWSKVVKMDNRTQKASLETACFSSDIQEVTVTFTLNYNIQKENAQKI